MMPQEGPSRDRGLGGDEGTRAMGGENSQGDQRAEPEGAIPAGTGVSVPSVLPLPSCPLPPGRLGRVWGSLKFCVVFSTYV